MSSRPTIIAGNWKMHKTIAEALLFIHEFIPFVLDAQSEIYLAVPFTCLSTVAEEVCDLKNIEVGAQNMSEHSDGPWTGEISARMVKEAGANFVILGHSERRQHFAESNGLINRKIKMACATYLQPIVCVGETLSERQQGKQLEVIEKQIRECLDGLPADDATHLILAYEPIWAIGTGENATPSDAQAIHQFCRHIIKDIFGEETSKKTPILYGGSVKPENAHLLLLQPDIDGLLVGGASLNAFTFNQIVHALANHQVS